MGWVRLASVGPTAVMLLWVPVAGMPTLDFVIVNLWRSSTARLCLVFLPLAQPVSQMPLPSLLLEVSSCYSRVFPSSDC